MNNAMPLARLPAPSGTAPTAAGLSRKQKAAIVVRLLLNEGADLSLTELPDQMQADLTTQMGSMRYVNRTTLADVVEEFATELEAMGLTFPRGVAGALTALDGRISAQTAARLRKEAGVRQFGDPWEQIKGVSTDSLLPIMETESIEVAAVMLSKLDVTRAAELLGKLPGEKARRITYAVSQTGAVTPDAVDRIGLSLAAQLHDQPTAAFDTTPVERVGAILNYSPSLTREDVLDGLDETDQDFATEVRKAIFTFANIPARVDPVDLPKITRAVEQPVLISALAYASEGDLAAVTEFILENMSKRMADTIREEMADQGKVKAQDGEDAMSEIITAIRTLEADGEVNLIIPEDDEGEGGG